MDDKTKKEFIGLFTQGFEEVVAPQLDELIEGQERLEDKVNSLDERISNVEDTLEVLETRVGAIERKLDRGLNRLQIKRLESRRILS